MVGSFDVTLALPAGAGPDVAPMRLERLERYRPGDARLLEHLAGSSDVTVVPLDVLAQFPRLGEVRVPLVIDLHDAVLLDGLSPGEGAEIAGLEAVHRRRLGALQGLLERGDFFICARDSQRDLWLGLLMAAGRLGPLSSRWDATARRLVDIVPFGIDDPALETTANPFEIEADARLIVWSETDAPALDPVTPVDAMAIVARRSPRARLVFARSSGPALRDTAMRSEALGLEGRVLFLESDAPNALRLALLSRAAVALSADHDELAARLSVREGRLDSIARGVPMVVTEGDALAELVRSRDLGRVVAPRDAEGMAAAMLELLEAPEDEIRSRRDRCESVRELSNWERAVEPLARFCSDPRVAADRAARSSLPTVFADAEAAMATPLSRLPSRALEMLRRDGLFPLLRRSALHLKWRLARGRSRS